MNEAQEAMFRIAELGSFNSFDGEDVVRLLRERTDLWDGMVFGRFQYSPLIMLRDIQKGYINADTMYITPKPGKEAELENWVLQSFGADEVDYDDWAAGAMGQYPNPHPPLRIWWD